MVRLAQLVRASDCGSEGQGFETLISPIIEWMSLFVKNLSILFIIILILRQFLITDKICG